MDDYSINSLTESKNEWCARLVSILNSTIIQGIKSIFNEANKILRDVIGNGKRVYKEARHEVKNAHPTWQKSVELLEYEDATLLYDGLKQMWDWAQSQPNNTRKFWESYEVEKGIYEFWKK